MSVRNMLSMYRRYTIHRDGDLLVEDLDPQGKPLDPEPVAPEDRLPVELVMVAGDDPEGKSQLLDLLELAYSLESEGPPSSTAAAPQLKPDAN